jgi:hypothetical protein
MKAHTLLSHCTYGAVFGCLGLPLILAQTPPPIPGMVPPAPHGRAAAVEAAAIADPQTPEELKEYPVGRYEQLWVKSPFLFEVIKPEVGPAVNPLADWSYTGYTVYPGKTTVTLVNMKDPTQTRIVANVPHDRNNPDGWLTDGFALPTKRVSAGDEVRIRTKDGQVYSVKADEKAIKRAPVANAMKSPNPAGPGGMQRPQGMPPIPGMVNPSIPANPNVAPGQIPMPPIERRRVVLPPPSLQQPIQPPVPTAPTAPVPIQ